MSCAAIAYEPFGAKMPAPKASFNACLQRIANKAVPSHCGRCVRPVLGSIYLWDTPNGASTLIVFGRVAVAWGLSHLI